MFALGRSRSEKTNVLFRLSASSLPNGGTLRLSRNDQRYAMVTCLLRVHACMHAKHSDFPRFGSYLVPTIHTTTPLHTSGIIDGFALRQILHCGQGVRNAYHSHLTSSRRLVIDRRDRDHIFTCSRASSLFRRLRRTYHAVC
jgi:hypothetical protein